MSIERLLFIGGVLDGERREVDTSSGRYRAQVHNPPSTTSFTDWETDQKLPLPMMEVHAYSMGRVRDQDGTVHKLMVLDGIKDPMRHLIDRYGIEERVRSSAESAIIRIANLAHHGGLTGHIDADSVLIEIRRVALPWWDSSECDRLQRTTERLASERPGGNGHKTAP